MVFIALPKGVDGFVDVAEHDEYRGYEQQAVEGNPESVRAALTEERLVENLVVQVVEFKDMQRPVNAEGEGVHH